MNRVFLIAHLLLATSFSAQEAFTEYQVWPLGGKAEFDQVLETQLHLPEILLDKHFTTDIKVNFSIDSAGMARDLVIEGTKNNYLRNEIPRIMRFYRFKPSSIEMVRAQPYFVMFHLTTKDYRKYIKQRSRNRSKMEVVCDSSMCIVSKADRSPVYFKNGDEGLRDYILSEISYPEAAIEKSIEGTVLVEFVVETNGFVTGIHVKQGVGVGCSEEAERLIRKTRWQPALVNGKAVRYRMNYPITFSLRSGERNGLFQPATSVGN